MKLFRATALAASCLLAAPAMAQWMEPGELSAPTSETPPASPAMTVPPPQTEPPAASAPPPYSPGVAAPAPLAPGLGAPNVPGPYEVRPYSAQPYSTQPYSTQPYSTQPYSTQPYSTQPYTSRPYTSRPYTFSPQDPRRDSFGQGTPGQFSEPPAVPSVGQPLPAAPTAPPQVESWPDDPAAKGLAVARAAADYDTGFGSTVAVGRMVLHDAQGATSDRAFNVRTLEDQVEGDKSLFVFTEPADIADTALLSHAHRARDDDQWLFLPALRRVKRISSSNKSGSFVGSEFSYEDLVASPVEKFTYAWLRYDPCPGAEEFTCHVIDRMPVDSGSGYSRHTVWVEEANYRTHQVEYFDRKGAHLKTLRVSGHSMYNDRYWRPHLMVMTNHQNRRMTEMIWQAYDFSVALTDQDLSKRALERLR